MAGTITTSTIQNDTSSPPTFRNNSVEIGTLCRAWVNFNGTGTVAIRASFNVSSITDGGTGVFTVNFTTAMPDADYSVSGSAGNATASSGTYFNASNGAAPTTSALRINLTNSAASNTDRDYVYVAVFR